MENTGVFREMRLFFREMRLPKGLQKEDFQRKIFSIFKQNSYSLLSLFHFYFQFSILLLFYNLKHT